jgi:hypothetical protein
VHPVIMPVTSTNMTAYRNVGSELIIWTCFALLGYGHPEV